MRLRMLLGLLTLGLALVARPGPLAAQTDDPSPPTECHDRCVAEAHELYRACIIEGGSEEDCAARARHSVIASKR